MNVAGISWTRRRRNTFYNIANKNYYYLMRVWCTYLSSLSRKKKDRVIPDILTHPRISPRLLSPPKKKIIQRYRFLSSVYMRETVPFFRERLKYIILLCVVRILDIITNFKFTLILQIWHKSVARNLIFNLSISSVCITAVYLQQFCT
jgi:hypothetical protein